MASRPPILPDMPIFGSDGVLVGTVHRVSGVRIVLNRIGVVDTDLSYIALARVADVSDRVTLDCPAVDALPSRVGEASTRSRLLAPVAVLALAALGLALVYGVISLVLRDRAKPTTVAAAAAVAPVAVVPLASAAAPKRAPVAAAGSVGPLPATAGNVMRYLASDAPTPQRFSLDFVAGKPGAGVDTDAAVHALTRVMTTHLNTMIKLSVAPGGARRAAAIRAQLIAAGVPDYRIVVGVARGRRGQGGSGVDLVILRK